MCGPYTFGIIVTNEHAKMTRESSFHPCLENRALLQNILHHVKTKGVRAAGSQEHVRAFHHSQVVQVRYSIKGVGSIRMKQPS